MEEKRIKMILLKYISIVTQNGFKKKGERAEIKLDYEYRNNGLLNCTPEKTTISLLYENYKLSYLEESKATFRESCPLPA
jgi:hypothetical protein